MLILTHIALFKKKTKKLYNVVLFAAVRQSESAIPVHISPFLGFLSHLGGH